jgi:hypothetical protein
MTVQGEFRMKVQSEFRITAQKRVKDKIISGVH